MRPASWLTELKASKFFRTAKDQRCAKTNHKSQLYWHSFLLGASSGVGQKPVRFQISCAQDAQGTLTVTLNVASSVGLVTGPDGQQKVVVANAAATSDNVSSLRYVRLTDVNAADGSASQRDGNASRKRRKK